jgi:hypothetical protein
LKKFRSAALAILLAFPLLTQTDIILNQLSVSGTQTSVLERDQGCIVAVEAMEFCFHKKIMAGECCVGGVIVMVKKPAMFLLNVDHFFLFASHRCHKSQVQVLIHCFT